MQTRITQVLLLIIAVALVAIAMRSYVAPTAVVQAQGSTSDPMWFEPGVYTLRLPEGGQVFGKVAVNLRTGNVWGFPTNVSDPYPSSPLDAKPQVSHPIPLGRFVLNEAR